MLSPINFGNPVHRDAPINKGLVAWYYGLPNNSGGVTWFDLLGQYPATLVANPSRRPGVVSSTIGNWVDFTSASSQYGLATASATALPIAVSLWFNPKQTNLSQSLFALCTAGASDQSRYQIIVDNTAKIQGQSINSAGTSVPVTTTTSYVANAWQHAMVAYRTTTDRSVWLNAGGIATDSITASSPSAPTILNLATRTTTTGSVGAFFNGGLGSVRIFSRLGWGTTATRLEYAEGLLGYPTAFNRYPPRAWQFGVESAAPPASTGQPYYYQMLAGGPSF